MLQEYAVRYGTKVSGWWIDGCFRRPYGFNESTLKPFHDAVRAGNPQALVAMNNGVHHPIGARADVPTAARPQSFLHVHGVLSKVSICPVSFLYTTATSTHILYLVTSPSARTYPSFYFRTAAIRRTDCAKVLSPTGSPSGRTTRPARATISPRFQSRDLSPVPHQTQAGRNPILSNR